MAPGTATTPKGHGQAACEIWSNLFLVVVVVVVCVCGFKFQNCFSREINVNFCVVRCESARDGKAPDSTDSLNLDGCELTCSHRLENCLYARHHAMKVRKQ